jgi:serine/threonine-protein kinase
MPLNFELGRLKKLLPYITVFLAFSAAVIILIMLVDWLLLPSLLHDKGVVKVPDVTGKQLAEAEKILEKSGLRVQSVSDQFSESVPSGAIINQNPKADEEVKKDRGVYLIVSKGQETLKMPNLIGQPIRTARLTLTNAGLLIGTVDYQSSDLYGKDTVIRQSKPKDASVPYNTTINITVSSGAEMQVAVPSLVAKSFEEINKILQESGLGLGEVTYEKNSTYTPNTVLSQSPEAGTLVNTGAKVNVTISK